MTKADRLPGNVQTQKGKPPATIGKREPYSAPPGFLPAGGYCIILTLMCCKSRVGLPVEPL